MSNKSSYVIQYFWSKLSAVEMISQYFPRFRM